uniref:Methionine adenosyltransferase 2 subunit beta n=1 Tax=Petromyzon marinus TaxID=7757 RepID=S4RXI3_PETMA
EESVRERRVLVTGATGLLGRAVHQEFLNNGWQPLGTGLRRARPHHLPLDLCDDAAVHNLVQDFKPHVVVHCAAERRPDVVENEPHSAHLLNVVASATLARETAQVGGFLVYISTDYVFDGSSPPYSESAEPRPLSAYGRSKLEGEQATLREHPGAFAPPPPHLFGDSAAIEQTSVGSAPRDLMTDNFIEEKKMWDSRDETDVTEGVRNERKYKQSRSLQDPAAIRGIYHWSGNEKMTKYEMACAMADAFNLPSSHLRPVEEPPSGVPRPHDAHLDTSLLESLGVGQRTPFRQGIHECLWPFLDDNRWRQTVFH